MISKTSGAFSSPCQTQPITGLIFFSLTKSSILLNSSLLPIVDPLNSMFLSTAGIGNDTDEPDVMP
jgi:hypothetical protein